MSEEERERRNRLRANIRDFYDVQVSPERAQYEAQNEPHHGASQVVSVEEELDLDSEHFNPMKYTTKILQEKSLKGLFEVDTQLRRKVRELDGDLQTLVYDNYSKFIAATDTIREMKSTVTQMDSKLQELSSNVESIDHVSQAITENLKVHRANIEEMLAVNKMLQKIQFLVELPDALKKFLEKKRYTAAVKYWAAGDAILKKSGTIGSFHRTHDECREIAEGIYSVLLQEIRSTPLSADKVEIVREFVEDVRLLLPTSIQSPKPHPEFESEMFDLMVITSTERFHARMAEIFEKIEGLHPDADGPPLASQIELVELKPIMSELREACFELKAHIERALSAVGGPSAFDFQSATDGGYHGQRGQVKCHTILKTSISSALSEFTNLMSKKLQLTWTRWLQNAALEIAADPKERASHMMKQKANKKLITEFVDEKQSKDEKRGEERKESGSGKVDPSDLQAQADDMIAVVVHQLREVEELSRDIGLSELLTATIGGTNPSVSLSEQQTETFLRCKQIISNGVKAILDQMLSFVETYSDDVKGHLLISSQTSSSSVRSMAVLKNFSRQTCLRSILVVAAFAKLFARVVIPEAAPSLIEQKAALDGVYRRIVHSFIPKMGMEYCSMLRTSMDSGNWTQKKEPSDVSGMIALLVEEWVILGRIVTALFPVELSGATSHRRIGSGGSGAGSVDYHHGSGSGASASKSQSSTNKNFPLVANFARREQYTLVSNVDRMFSKNTGTLNLKPGTMDAVHIVEACISYTLKGWEELVRLKHFNKGGFQQVQVDASYILISLQMHQHVWFKREERMVMLVNDTLGSVYERCSDRVPLSGNQVEQLARAKYNGNAPHLK